MEKNTAGKWIVFAFQDEGGTNPGEPVTGDAANITANIRIDGGAANAVDDLNPTELEDGYYVFDITAAEANGDLLLIAPQSATANVNVIGVPAAVWTVPANFNDLAVTSITGLTSADIISISGDSVAADNLEAQYDGTGLTGGTYPATQAQIDGIAVGSGISGLATSPAGDNSGGALNGVTLVGTIASGTYIDLAAATGVYVTIDDATNSIDYVIQLTIPINAVPTSLIIDGYLNGAGDTMGVYVYEFDGPDWELETTILGQNGTDNISIAIPLGQSKYVGTNGEIYVRFTTTGGANQQLNLDRVLVGYQNQTIGYAMGAVWIDTGASNTNTTKFVDGVADNPVSTIAAANTIATSLGLNHFKVAPASSLTLGSSQAGDVFDGNNWTLNLNGQSVAGARFSGASNGVTGTCTGANPFFYECSIGTVTLPPCALQTCGFTSTMTIGSAGNFFLVDCFSQVAGASSPVLDMGAAVGATNVSIRRWSGGLTINNLAAGDVISLDGIFGTITLNGADAQVEIRGIAKAVVNNLTGSPTVNDDSVKADSLEAVLEDTGTTLPAQITALNDLDASSVRSAIGLASANLDTQLGAIVADTGELQTDWADGGRLDLILDSKATQTSVDTVDTVADAIKAKTDSLTFTVANQVDSNILAISGSTTSANNLEASASTIVVGTAQTGTLSTTQMTTNLTEATDDHYNGRIIIWTSGALKDQGTNITDYDGTTKMLTFTAVTEPPSNGNTFVII